MKPINVNELLELCREEKITRDCADFYEREKNGAYLQQEECDEYAAEYKAKCDKYAARHRAEADDIAQEIYTKSRQLDDAIKQAEGRATARTLSVTAVLDTLLSIDARFKFAHKKDKNGMVAEIDYHAQDFPRAYKYTPESTQFRAEYKRNAWYITDIRRDACNKTGRKIIITMPEALKEALIKYYSRDYS